MNVQDVVEELTQTCMEIRHSLRSFKSDRKEQEKLLFKHFATFASKDLRINDFQTGLEWFNVAEGLSTKRHLSGKIVILDFFTYCCINCMHILPDLYALEQKFSVNDGLVVIGVHSAKFSNERDSTKLLSAVQRYNITHPVVNDVAMSMWRDIGVACWPTLVMLGPAAQPLAVFVGEGHRDELFLYVETALAYFKSLQKISHKALPLQSAARLLPLSKDGLSFPGKLNVFRSEHGTKLVVSDTGNNRIFVTDTDGNVEHTIGGDNPDYRDGDFESARFNAPQGVCTHENSIYVADNQNHCIRKVDLTEKTVTTVAGTGEQGHDYVGGKVGTNQPLSSPWDVAIYYHTQEKSKAIVPVLLIALAGTHQIWSLFLEDTVWWKNRTYKTGTCVAIVGSGREENRNNSYPHSAGLAQPSGLAVAQEKKLVYFADSESSAVRSVNLESGRVSGLCGANKNPLDLHDYGDADGTQHSAKLQHPLGVAWHPSENLIYVVDTYNHKVKRVDESGKCKAIYGDGKPNGTFTFDEPSGIAVDPNGQVLYVADTNNHAVKAIDMKGERITTLSIRIRPGETLSKSDETYEFDLRMAATGGDLNIALNVVFAHNEKLNEGSVQRWTVELPRDTWVAEAISGKLATPISLRVPQGSGTEELRVTLDIVICKTTECMPKRLTVLYKVHRDSNASTSVTERTRLPIKQ